MDQPEKSGVTLLTQIQAAIASGSIADAESILAEAVNRDPKDVNAWWCWVMVARTPQEQRLYLRRVLALAPDHQQARAALDGFSRGDPGTAVYMDQLRQSIIGPVKSAAAARPQESQAAEQKPRTIEHEPLSLHPADSCGYMPVEDQKPAGTPSRPVPVPAPRDAGNMQSRSANTADAPGARKLEPTRPEPNLEIKTRQPRDGAAPLNRLGPATSQPYIVGGDAATMTPAYPLWKQGVEVSDGAGVKDNVIPIALAYLVALTMAEVFTVFVTVRVGVLMHMGLLLLLLFHTVRRLDSPDHRLWASLSLVPLIRIISLSLPLSSFTLFYWFLFTSIPLFAATFLVMRLLSMSWDYVGANLRNLPLQVPIAFLGFALGYVEYLILKPAPLIDELALVRFWWPALIIMISTGFLEELLFRGVFQRTAVEMLGRARGVIYVAIFFGVLHIGYKSLIDVIFVTAVGLIFGWLVLKTRSIVGVTLAHGITNIMLFLIMPFVANGTVQLPF